MSGDGKRQNTELTRRDLLRLGCVTAVGLSSGGTPIPAGGTEAAPIVPTRPFGKSGERVSALALGGYFDTLAHPELLTLALERGVTYWEATLARGAAGYGAHFRKRPGDRERVFLLGKAKAREPEGMERELERVLADAASSYVDFFVVSSVSDVDFLTPALRDWVEGAKRKQKFRHFGFSTHANMQLCMTRAAALGWVDGIVTTYNYRLMHEPEMKRAVEACAQAGIALTAIKSQALPTNPAADIGRETADARVSLGGLGAQGSGLETAKLRAVWSDPRIASILSLMPDRQKLEANAAAAHTETTFRERLLLQEHAVASAHAYCAGCARLCESRLREDVPVARVMRYLMYGESYGDPQRARAAFAALPARVRETLADVDYTSAELHCPQGLPIGSLMRRASLTLG